MTRKIKPFGIALVAMAAIGIAAGATARASELHVTHEGTAVITGEQTEPHAFTTTLGTATCGIANFEGSASGAGPQITAQELTVTATYSNCIAFGLGASVQMNGCKYTITSKLNQTTEAGKGYADIAGCTAGTSINVNAGFGSCIVTIGEQSNLSQLVFTNKGFPPKEQVEANIVISGIKYQYHGALCPGAATEQRNDGIYIGEAISRAYKRTEATSAVEFSHQFTRAVHGGAQVGLLAT
jgi:hypothetical protein